MFQMIKRALPYACILLTSVELALSAPLGSTITYQGQLKSSGVPLNASVNMTFKLYDGLAAGNLLGTQTINGVPIADGLFTVELNAAGQLGANAFNGDKRWIEISVNATPLSPRQPINAAPYALYTLGGSGPWQASGPDIFNTNVGDVGIGTSAPTTKLDVRGDLTLANPGGDPTIYTGSGTGGFSRSLLLVGSLEYPEAAELKAGGVLVSDNYSFADPGKNDLIVKGNVGIGTATPHHKLRISGGPSWTSNLWSGALELDNAAALAWQPNAAGSRFGIGQTTGGLSFFHSFSDPGTTGESAIYDMTIADSGRVGIGTSTPAFPLTIQKTGYGWVHTDGVRELGSFVNSSGAFLGTRSNDPLHLFTANSTSQVTLTTAGNLGIGTTNPGQRLDVSGRLRTRQGADGSAGMWLYQSVPSADRAFVGMRDDNAVGFYGNSGVGWGLTMDVATGIVGIGTNTPSTTTRLDVVTSGAGYWAVHGDSPNGSGVVGTSAASGNAATGGINSAVGGLGVYGEAANGTGVWGRSSVGIGVLGECPNGDPTCHAIHGSAVSGGVAGYFSGPVQVFGNLSKNSGDFKIDHPLDPANKYLRHSFVESPDMMNVYNGNITTDAEGYATITMPDWFEALNKDFRYQLTIIDTRDGADFVQAKVVREVENNQFTIRTSRPAARVSWQVTGIRQDAWANAHRIVVEGDKPERERGKYLNPEVFGASREMGIGYLPPQKTPQ